MPFVAETLDVDYEDIYYLDLDKMNIDTVKATHAITFMNSNQPLITAPVSIFMKTVEDNSSPNEDSLKNKKDTTSNSQSFLVQGSMEYTNRNEPVTIDITTAGDVKGILEIETGEEKLIKESKQEGKDNLYSLEKDAKFTIYNKKTEPSRCIVKVCLVGKMEKCKPQFTQKTELSNTYLNINLKTNYSWDITIPPMECSSLHYKYTVNDYRYNM